MQTALMSQLMPLFKHDGMPAVETSSLITFYCKSLEAHCGYKTHFHFTLLQYIHAIGYCQLQVVAAAFYVNSSIVVVRLDGNANSQHIKNVGVSYGRNLVADLFS